VPEAPPNKKNKKETPSDEELCHGCLFLFSAESTTYFRLVTAILARRANVGRDQPEEAGR